MSLVPPVPDSPVVRAASLLRIEDAKQEVGLFLWDGLAASYDAGCVAGEHILVVYGDLLWPCIRALVRRRCTGSRGGTSPSQDRGSGAIRSGGVTTPTEVGRMW